VSHLRNHCCHVTATIRYILIVVVDAAVNNIKVFSAATETHLSLNKIFRTYINSSKYYTTGLRKWLPQLICSNFIIVGLNTKLLLAQHIPLLSYTG
jgi:hypothetical protein